MYRNENRLILLDGYTGKESPLPLEVKERDLFNWSPDGRYLLARLYQGDDNGYCLNLYDVDKQKWTQNKPISCAVQEALFSDDGSQVFYSTNDKTNGALSVYNLKDKNSQDIYRTKNQDSNYPDGISDLKWSPTKTYLTFEQYNWIMGGTLNSLVVLNVKNGKYVEFNAPDAYYASYYPIWSADDYWFIVTLQDEYVTSGSLPITNNQGDVYLGNSENGKLYRLTYTPAANEINVHWTDDGKIAFTEVTEENFSYTLDQAMTIEAVPLDQIITPEPVEKPVYYDPAMMISPDPNLGAWTTQTQRPDKTYTFELVIGDASRRSSDGKFSVPISDPNQSGTILIGWRPSDYLYSQG